MELASRIVSVLLALVVAVFILWPVTIPVGFGQAWWASKQMATQPTPTSPPAAADPAATPALPSAPVASAVLSGSAPRAAPAKPEEGKHAVLAAEKAEAERLVALSSKNAKDAAPAARSVPTKLYYRVTVRDAGTLQSGGTTIRLAGITARDVEVQGQKRKELAMQRGGEVRARASHPRPGRKLRTAQVGEAEGLPGALQRGGNRSLDLGRARRLGSAGRST